MKSIKIRNNLDTKKGFTLIELLVVVAIIGVLAAVGTVAYSGYTKAAKRNATLQQHKQAVRFIKQSSPDLILIRFWNPFFALCYSYIINKVKIGFCKYLFRIDIK